MLVTIVPAGPKTATATIEALLAGPSPPERIRAVYRTPNKAPKNVSSNPTVEIVKGDTHAVESLDFSGSDVVLAITPPAYTAPDVVAAAEKTMTNIKTAVERAGTVKKLILLSSVGAHLSQGVGEIKTNYVSEQILADTKVSEIVFVRCAYFMENWASSLATLKAPTPFMFSPITPVDFALPMVSVRDIGHALAAEITSVGRPASGTLSPKIYDLQGPKDYAPSDVQKAFSDLLGKPVEVKPVEKEGLHDFFSQALPPQVVPAFVEMTLSILSDGALSKDRSDNSNAPLQRGKTDIVTAMGEILGGQN